jgi:hypothetical protein
MKMSVQKFQNQKGTFSGIDNASLQNGSADYDCNSRRSSG